MSWLARGYKSSGVVKGLKDTLHSIQREAAIRQLYAGRAVKLEKGLLGNRVIDSQADYSAEYSSSVPLAPTV